MVEHKDGGTVQRYVFKSGNFYPAKIDSQSESQDRDDDAPGHPILQRPEWKISRWMILDLCEGIYEIENYPRRHPDQCGSDNKKQWRQANPAMLFISVLS